MAYSSKLCNPTPFDIKLPWDRGINIKIEAFGSTDLTMQQMDDFRPGKPGSAQVSQVLNYHGLFLLDADRPYDNQALDSLKRACDAKKSQYDAAVKNIIDQRSRQGIAPNEEALEEALRQMGYVELKRKIEVLTEAIKRFAAEVGDQPERSMRTQLDPKRTVFVVDPPREFPSVAAMEFFLDQNPDVRAKHEAFSLQASGNTVTKTPTAAAVQQFVKDAANDSVGEDAA